MRSLHTAAVWQVAWLRCIWQTEQAHLGLDLLDLLLRDVGHGWDVASNAVNDELSFLRCATAHALMQQSYRRQRDATQHTQRMYRRVNCFLSIAINRV